MNNLPTGLAPKTFAMAFNARIAPVSIIARNAGAALDVTSTAGLVGFALRNDGAAFFHGQ